MSSTTYNSYGDVASSTDALSRTTSFTHNKRRQLLTTKFPSISGELAAEVTQSYDNEGMPSVSTDANGNVASQTYSATAKPLVSTAPVIPVQDGGSLNNTLTKAYDTRDMPISSINSLAHTSGTTYDFASRVIESKDPLNRTSTISYNENSLPVATTDPLARTNQIVYTARSEANLLRDGLNKDTASTFDKNGNLLTRLNRRGKTHSYIYDAANRLTTSTTPTGKVTLMSYFKNDLPQTITEPSGQVTTLAYDSRIRLQTKTDPVGSISYGYNSAGELLTVTEGTAVFTRTYDARGRLKTYTNADGDLIQYNYDSNNNLTRLTYPDGKQVNYTYNARNLLTSVTDWASRVTSYQYDRIGRLVGVTRPNNTSCTMSYDAASQLLWKKEIANGRIISYLNFQYDAAGQIKKKLRAPLVNSGWQQPSFTATYDDDNRLVTINGTTIIHDADGNMTNGPIKGSTGVLPVFINLTYNSRNRLTNVAGISYTYDAEGHRRTIIDSSGTTSDTIDAASSKLLVRTAPGGVKTYYVYGIGLLYEANAAGQTKTYHFDQVGSTIARTNDAGVIIGQAEYSAYGALFWKTGDMATPFLYNGQAGVQTDANGLLNMRARYYSPYLMRFLNADPSGFGGGPNWFAYADGNPLSLSDPFGLTATDRIFGGLKAVGGGVEVAAGITFGAATSWTGIGAVAGGAVALHGADTFQSGIRQAWTGNPTDSFTSAGLQAVGMSQNAANLTDTGIGILGSFGASGATGALRTAGGLTHLTNDANAGRIMYVGELAGNNYAGPLANAGKSGWGVTAATGLSPGVYASVDVPAAAASAFSPIRGIGPITSWQAMTGQVYTANGTLSLSSGAFSRAGTNLGQATFYGLDAGINGARIAGSIK